MPSRSFMIVRTFSWSCLVAVLCVGLDAHAQQPEVPSDAPQESPVPEVEVQDVVVPDHASAVPSDLATAQWGALPDDGVANDGSEQDVLWMRSEEEPSQRASDVDDADREFVLGGRVMAGFHVRDRRPVNGQRGNAGTSYGFGLQQARLRADFRPNKRLRVVVSADFADALDPTDFDPPPYIRNAYLQFVIEKRWLELRVGRFKRPYSRFELRSVADLPFRGRGLTNGLIVEDGQWGDRAVGAMIRGRIDAAHVRWWLSASNPQWRVNAEPEGLDLLARVTWDITDAIEVGASGGRKWTQTGLGERVAVNALGVDARLKVDELYVMAEVLMGQQAQITAQPVSMGVVAAASYRIRVSKNVRVQPTLFGEWADADTEFTGNDAVRAVFGVNLLWKKSFRVMPQFELIRPLGTVSVRNAWPASDRFLLTFAAQI